MSYSYADIEGMQPQALRTLYNNIGRKLFNIETEKGEKFSSQLLSMYLYKTQPSVTMRDNGQMFVYDFEEGNYRGNGQTLFIELIRDILREKYKNSTAEEVIKHIKAMTFKERKDFKLPLNLIPVRNGILKIPLKNGGDWDFDGMKLIPNSPEFFTINRIPVEYNSTSKCPVWDRFIEQIFHEKDLHFIQEYVGYCLYRDFIYHKVFMLKGPTRTGKSTFLSTISALLGETNVVSIPLHDLSEKFQRVRVYHKLANLLSDLSKKQLKNVSMFKQMTGNDLISARNLYENAFEFVPYAKYGWSCNEIPPVEVDDPAYWIRWQIILVNKRQFFDGVRGTDPRLRYKFINELPGILNWALRGLRRLIEQGYFTNADSWDVTQRLWWIHSDTLGSFMYSDLIRFSSAGSITKDRLYDLYVDWCTIEGTNSWSKEKIGREISKRFSNRVETARRGPAGEQEYIWEGIEETAPEPHDPDTINELYRELERDE